jgi:hypothetical protein
MYDTFVNWLAKQLDWRPQEVEDGLKLGIPMFLTYALLGALLTAGYLAK